MGANSVAHHRVLLFTRWPQQRVSKSLSPVLQIHRIDSHRAYHVAKSLLCLVLFISTNNVHYCLPRSSLLKHHAFSIDFYQYLFQKKVIHFSKNIMHSIDTSLSLWRSVRRRAEGFRGKVCLFVLGAIRLWTEILLEATSSNHGQIFLCSQKMGYRDSGKHGMTIFRMFYLLKTTLYCRPWMHMARVHFDRELSQLDRRRRSLWVYCSSPPNPIQTQYDHA